MDRLAFEAALRTDGFSVVNGSQKPNAVTENHCHDFDARLLVLGGEITITRDNTPQTFRAGYCCEVPAGCMHAEHAGPEGVAFVSGRRRTDGALTAEAFESDLRREGFAISHGGQKPGTVFEAHCHDTTLRFMVLGGQITLVRGDSTEVFRAGQCCEVAAGCLHTEIVGPEGAAYIIGRAPRPAA